MATRQQIRSQSELYRGSTELNCPVQRELSLNPKRLELCLRDSASSPPFSQKIQFILAFLPGSVPSAFTALLSYFLNRHKAGRRMSTLEPVSGQVGLCFPGKVIFGGRDRTAITSVSHRARNPETRLTRRKAPIRGVWRRSPEISAVRLVIGGAMRTRTKDPDGFIDGARRDRCCVRPMPLTLAPRPNRARSA